MKNLIMTRKMRYGYLFSAVLAMLLFGLMSFQAAAQTPVLPGTIGQTVYHDLNRNFAQDPGEGLPNVTVELLDSSGTVTQTAVTDENGMYQFDDLPLGDYKIRIATNTLPDDKQGAANVSDPDSNEPDESETTLTATASTDFTQNFGYFGLPTHVTMANSTAVSTSSLPLFLALLALTVVAIPLIRVR